MNSTASYTAIITVIAIIVVISLTFSSTMVVQVRENNLAQAVLETKKEWQNVSYLLDKTTADALEDEIVAAGQPCTALTGNRLNSYFNKTMDYVNAKKGIDFNCAITSGPTPVIGAGNPKNVTVDVTFYCGKTVGKSFVRYEKNADFEKNVKSFKEDESTCFVDIKDVQSGVCEIDRIPDGANNYCS